MDLLTSRSCTWLYSGLSLLADPMFLSGRPWHGKADCLGWVDADPVGSFQQSFSIFAEQLILQVTICGVILQRALSCQSCQRFSLRYSRPKGQEETLVATALVLHSLTHRHVSSSL